MDRSAAADRWGDAALRLPGIHLVPRVQAGPRACFSLAKRWLLGTHHGAVSPKHLQAGPWPRAGLWPDPGLEEFVFRLDRRTAQRVSHGFARLVEHAVQTPPVTYRGLVDGAAA